MSDKPIIGHGRFDAYTNHSRSHEAVGANVVISAWGHDNSGTMFPSQDGHWVLKSDYDALQADNARLRKDYEEGLEAWKKNNEFFGGWCERLANDLSLLSETTFDRYVMRLAAAALTEYKAARGARG